MQTFDNSTVHVFKNRGQMLIAMGLAILFVAFCWPAAPVVSGMALIALGATLEVVARLGGASRFRPLVVVHAAIYGNLYLVFVGAVCHAALTGPRHGLSWEQGSDLLLSAVPMSVVARLAIRALAESGNAPAR
jgi:hypothetical protein